jgi:hypothetical protein
MPPNNVIEKTITNMKSIHQFKRLSMEQKLLAIDRAGIDLCLALFRTDESCMLYALHHFMWKLFLQKLVAT